MMAVLLFFLCFLDELEQKRAWTGAHRHPESRGFFLVARKPGLDGNKVFKIPPHTP
jgi:hypothetical protein